MSQAIDSSLTANVTQARQQMRAVGRRYVVRRAAALILPALAAAGLLAAVARHWPALGEAVAVTAGALVLLLGWRLWPLRKLTTATIAPRLDRQFAELEDSTGLLLRAPASLNLLEQFQQQRVARRVAELQATDALTLPVNFRRAAWLTGTVLLAGVGVWYWPVTQSVARPAGVAVHFPNAAPPARPGQTAPPRITETTLLVTPPAYTRLAAFAPAQASFQCPQETRVRWQVRVSGAGGSAAPVLELGRKSVSLQPVAGQAGTFFTEQILNASTLYRLRYAGTVSDDYAIDVRPDQAPVLHIITPKSYTLVAAVGQQPEVPIRATVRDDYGLSRAELVITVAQGQGEAVKFRELRRDLSAALGGRAQANLSSALNLPTLGLTYGDELYFYLTARDNHGHTTRTDSYLVQWQDTAVADSPTDMGMGVKVAPAYFRSQRQIIIDTEKLIAEKPRLDAATLASRANALGFDQQALRLRYGKFLGEESEAGIGAPAPRAPIAEDEDSGTAAAHEEHSEHDGHDHGPTIVPGRPSPTAETDALMDPYIHKHDDSETADFLEPTIKTKLHAVLDQMWAAELRLRTGQLAAARPYEYRALRLLKEVQQQTRAFVKKAGFTPPPMPEATLRLTGELAGAAAPRRQQNLPTPATQPAIRAALRWLAAAENGQPTRSADATVLDQAGTALAGAALTRPGTYLPALRALRELGADVRAGRPTRAAARQPVARALTDLLAPAPPAPAPPPAADRLARRYFQELSH